ncbi:pseudaminic acid cytidylyltransferase [Butyrivibrio sp. INlla14]|uniref:pseudaminic acid cytidylyltransferase n=1 Tax=Butyrivibrio sp. INlla14 TaxID=1520808 RepID=UPI000875FE2E|nr:pseudaminic acid cytidylyltransferase [Butyrivibrio sp. INlla14]SCY25423.1 N-acylneuraminate cytidylyltransferase [Butyrivibrio sp. INlla14]
MSSVAIITARGGSKRIPKKNIKEFCGKPILAYSIEAALKSGAFDEVMVSTDSQEIADIAREYGAVVPFMRSEANSNDVSTTADVLEEVISEYEKIGKDFDTLACIYPTAPFVTGEKLSDAMKKMQESGADALVSVVKFGFPPQRAFVIRNEKVCYQYPEYERARSQDLEKIYHDCGQFYILKKKALYQYHSLIVPNTIPYEIPEEEVQDIDTMSDWKIAEVKYTVLHQGE